MSLLSIIERLLNETRTDGYPEDFERFTAAVAEECARIVMDGSYWNGAPSIAYDAAMDRAKAIREAFAMRRKE